MWLHFTTSLFWNIFINFSFSPSSSFTQTFLFERFSFKMLKILLTAVIFLSTVFSVKYTSFRSYNVTVMLIMSVIKAKWLKARFNTSKVLWSADSSPYYWVHSVQLGVTHIKEFGEQVDLRRSKKWSKVIVLRIYKQMFKNIWQLFQNKICTTLTY